MKKLKVMIVHMADHSNTDNAEQKKNASVPAQYTNTCKLRKMS